MKKLVAKLERHPFLSSLAALVLSVFSIAAGTNLFDNPKFTNVFNFMPKEVWVSPDRSDSKGKGTQVDPFDGHTQAKFQAILDGLAAGSTIHVGPGTYPLYVLTVSKSVAIVGTVDSIFTQAVGGNTGPRPIFNVSNSTTTDFKLKGVSLQHGTTFYEEANAYAISGTGHKIELDDVHFSDFMTAVGFDPQTYELNVHDCSFVWKYGRAGVSDLSPYTQPAAAIVGQPWRLIVKKNTFDGLQDPTFTGTSGSPPVGEKKAADNFVQTSDQSFADIDGNIVNRNGIEGIYIQRSRVAGTSTDGIGNGTTTFTSSTTDFSIYDVGSVISEAGNTHIPSGTKVAAVTGLGFDNVVTSVTLTNSVSAPTSLSGTVAVTNGSAAVVGTSTSFTTVLAANASSIILNGVSYPVTAIADNTHLTLGRAYTGTTNGSLTAKAGIIFNLASHENYSYRIANNHVSDSQPGDAGNYTPAIILRNAKGTITNNTVFGAPIGIDIPFNSYTGSALDEKNNFVHITGNTLTNVITGMTVGNNSSTSTISGNTIHNSPEPVRTVYGNANIITGDMIGIRVDRGNVTNNTITGEEPVWDLTTTVTGRSSNVLTLASVTGIVNGTGVLISYAGGQVNYFPVTSVSGSNVTVDTDYSTAYPGVTSGTIYYQKYASNFTQAGGICGLSGLSGVIYADGNTISGHRNDYTVQSGATFVISGARGHGNHNTQPNNATFAYTVSPGAGNVTGSSALASAFNMTGSTDVTQDSGLAVTLPGPGTYRIVAKLPYVMIPNTGTFWEASAFLYNSTDAAEVTNSRTLLWSQSGTTTLRTSGTALLNSFVTVTASKTIKVYAVAFFDGSYTARLLYGDPTGRGASTLSYERVNPQ